PQGSDSKIRNRLSDTNFRHSHEPLPSQKSKKGSPVPVPSSLSPVPCLLVPMSPCPHVSVSLCPLLFRRPFPLPPLPHFPPGSAPQIHNRLPPANLRQLTFHFPPKKPKREAQRSPTETRNLEPETRNAVPTGPKRSP